MITGKHAAVLRRILLLAAGCALLAGQAVFAVENGHSSNFPKALSNYADPAGGSLGAVLKARILDEPFNLVATIIFALAITHTFLAPVLLRLSHLVALAHRKRRGGGEGGAEENDVSFLAEILHFLGEVEAVFGIWVVPLLLAITVEKGWQVARDYVGHGVNFTEPLFVVVIMAMAASRPVLMLAEQAMAVVARVGRGSPAAWWFSILTLGPLLGSFITEPAAMTISALLLSERFYRLKPRPAIAYATLGLLFVNVSVGGTLTHFAAPPVLMVAGKWGWGMGHMLAHFGWKAALGIVCSNLLYLLCFRRDFRQLAAAELGAFQADKPHRRAMPVWITVVHLLFLGWTVLNSHYPVLFIGGFLFYIAFTMATPRFQRELALRPALLVGFFLAGLVVHGGLQAWWIQPVLSSLSEVPLFLGATILTAFNDNAAITYLASLVPNFSPALQHAVVAGAVTGGGLTVIANAPNPAGQSILSRFFPEGVSPLWLFFGALIPTIITATMFLLFR